MPAGPLPDHLSSCLISPVPVQRAMLRQRGSGYEVMQAELRFLKNIPSGNIQNAWNRTVQHTEALSLGWNEDQGGGWEKRRPDPDTWREMAGAPPSDWEAWLQSDRLQDFPREKTVPWRVHYWPGTGCWVWTFHHALLDGRSIAAILRAFLRNLQDDPPAALSLPLWKSLTPTGAAEARDQLRTRLGDARTTPPDFPEGTAGTVRMEGDTLLTDALERSAAAAGVTPATVLIWAWGQVLARAAGLESVVLGQVRAGAPQPGCAGFSMNTLPVAVRRAGKMSAAAGWQEVARQLLALRACETLDPAEFPDHLFEGDGQPWAGVVMIEKTSFLESLAPGHSGLLQSAVLHERPSTPLLGSARLRPGLELEVSVNGSPGIEAAGEMAAHWLEIVRNSVRLPDAPAGEVSLLPATASGRLAAWEDGGPMLPGPAHLSGAWNESLERHRGETALWTPGESLTYDEFGSRARSVTESLVSAGVRPGQTVAVKTRQRSRWPMALIAVLGMGAIYVPLGPRVAPQRLRSIVRNSSPNVLLCCGEVSEDFGLPRIPLDSPPGHPPGPATLSAGNLPSAGPASPPMALLYTSGSTGTPKGVLLDHAGVLNEARWAARSLGLGPGDRLLQFSSPGFDASLEEMLSCLISGATLVPRPEEASENLEVFHRFLETAGITVLDLPTSFWSSWCGWMRETGRSVPPSVRSAIIGGERATSRALADWRAAEGRSLWNSYGPTEASIVAAAMEIGTSWHEPGDPPIGTPLPGCRIRIAGPDGAPVLPGASGEIWIGGPGVGPGYHGQEALTAKAFIRQDGGRWYRTGDRGRWDSQGRLRFLGRTDDQLKIRGHRVEPAGITRLLEAFPGIAAAHAGLWPADASGPSDPEHPPVLSAWVRWETQPPEGWQSRLATHLSASLPPAAIPSRWAGVDHFPLTERGKLDHRALPEPAPVRSAEYEAPATGTEQRIAAQWSALLGIPTPGRQDSFFDLGGNSLLALRLFAWLSSEFTVRLSLGGLAGSPSLAALAERVDQARAATQDATSRESEGPDSGGVVLTGGGAVESATGSARPLLFCIHGGDGGIFFYRQLAACLPAGQTLVAIEAPSLGAARLPAPVSVEKAAAAYLEIIRRRQPRGPYCLAGYSFGGVVAHAIAAALGEAGEEVVFTGLFDTENPGRPGRRFSLPERAAVRWQATAGQPWHRRAAAMAARSVSGPALRLWSGAELLAARVIGSRSAPYSRLRSLQVRTAHAAAMEQYRPAPLDITLTLFRTLTVDDKFETLPDYGWTGLARELNIIDAEGEHLTMFSPANAPGLARAVLAHLPPPAAPA